MPQPGEQTLLNPNSTELDQLREELDSARAEIRTQAAAVSTQARALTALHAIGAATKGVLAPEGMAKIVVQLGADLVGADAFRICRWDDKVNLLVDLAHTLSRIPDRGVVRLGEGALGQAALRREPVIVHDYPSWEYALPALVAAGVQSTAAVPLIFEDRVVGALGAASTVRREFKEDHVQMLALVAAQLAPALATGRLRLELGQAAAELQAASQALGLAGELKSQFIANMSHELRTPLSAIIGFSELMLDGADGALTPELADDVGQIQRSGRALLDMINDILDLSKLETGRISLQVESVDLAAVVNEVLASQHPLADSKGLGLHSHLPAGEVEVLADETRLLQIVSNLVSNGLKFTNEGSVSVSAERHGDEMEIAITDTGIGIPLEYQARIFDEFIQADASRTRRFGGSGLGLAITRRLVELQGGIISVESIPGEGSCFRFTLPTSQRDFSSEGDIPIVATWASEKENWSGQTSDLILVVDDDDNTRRIIVKRLQEAGYRAAQANGAVEALVAAKNLHPATITLDIMMPGADGWEVLHALKADPLTRDIPVVIISIVDGRAAAVALGAASYLTKPFTKTELVDSIRHALPHLEGANVLCVDDEPGARELVRRSLESAGVRVRTAASVAEAMAAIDEEVPDAIFADLMMPEVSGFEMITRLRAQPRLRQVPIIVLSGRVLTDEERSILTGQIDRFVDKGNLRIEDLAATIRQAVRYRQLQ